MRGLLETATTRVKLRRGLCTCVDELNATNKKHF